MSDFADAAAAVQDMKDDLETAADRGLESSMDTVVSALQGQLRANDSVSTRTLLQGLTSVDGPLDSSAAMASQQIRAPDYWKYLEYGTGIYTGRTYKAPDERAPLDPILNWVVSKGILPDPHGPYDTQTELAEAIAFSIGTGTEQHMFVRPVWRGPFGRDLVINTVKNTMESAVDMRI